MKVVLDLDQLLKEKKITREDYVILQKLSSGNDFSSIIIHIVMTFGALAVTVGVTALKLPPFLEIMFSVSALMIGLYILRRYKKQWKLLGNAFFLAGTLWGVSSVYFFFHGTIAAPLLATFILLFSGIIAESGFLIALAALSFSSLAGEKCYDFYPAECLFDLGDLKNQVFLYGLLAFVSYQWSKTLSSSKARLAIIFSRTSFLMINFAFFLGTAFYGGKIFGHPVTMKMFGLWWAVFLVAMGFWAALRQKRFVVNTVAVFGMIDFLIQWSEFLGETPLSFLSGGVITIIAATFLWKYNHR